MKYEDKDVKAVKDWLNNCKENGKVPYEYDFVEDTQPNDVCEENDYGIIQNAYEKYFAYKYSYYVPTWRYLANIKDSEFKTKALKNADTYIKKAKKYNVKDPDSDSVLLQNIYKLLWSDLVSKKFLRQATDNEDMKDEDGKMAASDTMTSASVRFKTAMQKIIGLKQLGNEMPSDSDLNSMFENIKKIYDAHNMKKPELGLWSIKFSIIVLAVLEEKDLNNLYSFIRNKYSCMNTFLDKSHTIGNYCPVPEGFNLARSGDHASHDYWDLTLMKIREWYLYEGNNETERDNIIQADLMHKKGMQLNCIRWLEYFGRGKKGWERFVDELYMQDYVYYKEDELKNKNKEYYEVKPFWDEHDWSRSNIDLPDDPAAINDALKKISDRITARSERIIKACREKIK